MTSLPEQRVLHALQKYCQDHGKSPSQRELASLLGYKSPGSISRLLVSLRHKGLINDSTTGWRSIQLCVQSTSKSISDIEIIGAISKTTSLKMLKHVQIIHVSKDLYPCEEPMYGLRIQDNSFISDHILKNDILLIKSDPHPSSGSYVIAFSKQTILGTFYEEEDTFLFFRRHREGEEEPTITPSSTTQIYGTILGIIRTY